MFFNIRINMAFKITYHSTFEPSNSYIQFFFLVWYKKYNDFGRLNLKMQEVLHFLLIASPICAFWLRILFRIWIKGSKHCLYHKREEFCLKLLWKCRVSCQIQISSYVHQKAQCWFIFSFEVPGQYL